jgi:Y_Y_Y domain
VITGENELYKYFGDRFTPYEDGFPLRMKSVRGAISRNKNNIYELDQEKSELKIEFVQPDFLAAQAVEYRYQLKGLDKTWSDWSSLNNEVDFAYLPSGDYSFKVQSRDIFGNIKEFEPVPFEVLPPYWKRPWFYALEFLVFAALVMLSFRLSTRFRIISRLLSLLTIIMLIQFIQTVIGEFLSTKTSPVIDFFVQVVVAFMILPVEGYLRNLMLRSLDSSSRIHKFLSPKLGLASRRDEQVK